MPLYPTRLQLVTTIVASAVALLLASCTPSAQVDMHAGDQSIDKHVQTPETTTTIKEKYTR